MKKIIIFLVIIFYSFICLSFASQRDSFVFSRIKNKKEVVAYPNVFKEIQAFLKQNINLKYDVNTRFLTFDDDIIFSSPFIVFTGRKKVKELTVKEKDNLEKFISGGGLLFINDVSLIRNSSFESSVREELRKVFPRYSFVDIPEDHAIFKSFYLVKSIGGLRRIRYNLQGIFIDSRLAIIFCHNDILGVWEKDNFGNYLYECIPGGYEQRKEAIKLLINIIMYSVTGDYKEDVIHKPFIESKKRKL